VLKSILEKYRKSHKVLIAREEEEYKKLFIFLAAINIKMFLLHSI
jgi:hypothetical protein